MTTPFNKNEYICTVLDSVNAKILENKGVRVSSCDINNFFADIPVQAKHQSQNLIKYLKLQLSLIAN